MSEIREGGRVMEQIDFDRILSQKLESMKVYKTNSICEWCEAFRYKQKIINCDECPIMKDRKWRKSRIIIDTE